MKSLALNILLLISLSLLLASCDRGHHAELLACRPERPLSKGELYEQAMRDYWNNQMNWAWVADKYLVEDFGAEDNDIATKACGLTRTWWGKPKQITNEVCYPWKIAKQQNAKDYFYTDTDSEDTYTEFLQNRGGIVYHPESDPPLYTEEFHSQDVNFSVVHSMPGSYWTYPEDCCKLMTYEQILALKEQYADQSLDKEVRVSFFEWSSSKLSTEEMDSLRNNYFLVIKVLSFDYGYGFSPMYFYNPISDCGRLFYHQN